MERALLPRKESLDLSLPQLFLNSSSEGTREQKVLQVHQRKCTYSPSSSALYVQLL